MKYTHKSKGKCEVCGVVLPVPSWKTCLIHDEARKSVLNVPVIKVRDAKEKQTIEPYIPPAPPEPYVRNKVPQYLGYKVCIPFKDFLKAEEYIIDEVKWEIIGWR